MHLSPRLPPPPAGMRPGCAGAVASGLVLGAAVAHLCADGRVSGWDGLCPPGAPSSGSPPCRRWQMLGLVVGGISLAERFWEILGAKGAFKLMNKSETQVGGVAVPLRRGGCSAVLLLQPRRCKVNPQPNVYTPL